MGAGGLGSLGGRQAGQLPGVRRQPLGQDVPGQLFPLGFQVVHVGPGLAVALGQQLEFPGGVIGLDLRCCGLELGHRLLLAEQFQFQGLPLPAEGVLAEVAHQEAHGRGGEGDQGQHQGQGSPGAVVAFNGLSTAGPMDFTQNLLRADPEAVADALEDQGNLVDLSGVHVVLTGLGDVAGEQAPLTLSAKENLQAIWQAYLTRCGAASVTFPGEYSTGQAPAGAPAVTPVPVLQDEPLSFLAQEGGLVLDDTSPLRFVGDEATYLDESAAQETLAPVAEALRANPKQQVLIVGTTASLPGQEAACQALSQARAETVQATLIELGVSPAQLATLGLGFDRDPWHIDDLGPDGLQVEANAQLNRKVVLLDAAGQEARGLMG